VNSRNKHQAPACAFRWLWVSPPSSAILLCLVIGLLLLATRRASATDDFLVITGKLTAVTYSHGSVPRSTNIHYYSVALQASGWNIKATNLFEATRSSATSDTPYRELGFDGQDMFRIIHVSKEAASKSRAAMEHGVTTIGQARTSNFPQGEDYFVSVIWLANASHDFWPLPHRIGFPSFFPRSSSSARIGFVAKTNHIAPYLPASIQVLSTEPSLLTRPNPSDKITKINTPNYLRGKLDVQGWVESAGKQYPKQFTFTWFENKVKASGEWEPLKYNEISGVQEIFVKSDAKNLSAMRPVVAGAGFYTDSRFNKKAGTLNYYQTNSAWIGRDDPNLVGNIATAKGQMIERGKQGGKRGKVITMCFAIVIVALTSCWSYSRYTSLKNYGKQNKLINYENQTPR
jgi:hypothetical protein